MKTKGTKHFTGDRVQDRANKLIDDLAEFESFKNSILPALRKDLGAGMTAQEIVKKYAAIAAARTVTIAAMEVDSGKALSAAKDIIDRAEGKAKEQVVHTHRYEELTDDELDAQVLSRAEEMAERSMSAGEAPGEEGPPSGKPTLN